MDVTLVPIIIGGLILCGQACGSIEVSMVIVRNRAGVPPEVG